MAPRLISAISLALLTVFFFNVCVFGVALSVQLHVHRQAQFNKIKNKKHKEIVELRIQRNEVEEYSERFQWKKDWEFCWKGEMYDIEDKYLDGETWVFFVKHDSKEDQIRKKIERHAQDETTKRNAQSKKNLKCGEFFEKICFSILNPAKTVAEAAEQPQLTVTPDRWVADPPPWFI